MLETDPLSQEALDNPQPGDCWFESPAFLSGLICAVENDNVLLWEYPGDGSRPVMSKDWRSLDSFRRWTRYSKHMPGLHQCYRRDGQKFIPKTLPGLPSFGDPLTEHGAMMRAAPDWKTE